MKDFKIKAKVQKNAEELALNGFCLVPARDLADVPTVLAVEAGPKYMKFFKRLLLHRVDWDARRGRKKQPEQAAQMDLEVDRSADHHIQLVWEGIVADHMFPKWSIKEIRSEAEGRKQFADRGVEEYWDMALAKTLPDLHN